AAAVRVDQVELRASIARQRDGEPAAVGRPRGRAVAAAEVRGYLPLAGRERLHIDDRLLVLQRDIRDARAVGRPDRRQERLVGGDDDLRVVAVGFGDQKLVARSLLGDVGDARAENAGVAGQLLVDDVGDLVRGGAKLRRRDDVGKSRELRLLHRVEQEEANLDAAVRLW